jgi:rhomboid-like protein
MGILILANVVVWALWKVPPAWKFMNRYFILTPAVAKPLSLFGAMFSHQGAGHRLIAEYLTAGDHSCCLSRGKFCGGR